MNGFWEITVMIKSSSSGWNVKMKWMTTVLSNRNKVKKLIIIKADMSKDERKVGSILLQERWKLIQRGTNRKHNSIRKNEIFVGKLLHAKVVNQNLIQCKSQAVTTDTVSSPVTLRFC